MRRFEKWSRRSGTAIALAGSLGLFNCDGDSDRKREFAESPSNEVGTPSPDPPDFIDHKDELPRDPTEDSIPPEDLEEDQIDDLPEQQRGSPRNGNSGSDGSEKGDEGRPGGDAIPEPATLIIVGGGLAGMGLMRRRRQKRKERSDEV